MYLVGAGPGDPGLMTRRALELIARSRRDPLRPADPVRRSGRRAGGRRADLRRQGPGRRGDVAGGHQRPARGARAKGRRVVRLKGGDPFVFGRGGEEAEALRAAGVAFEVVPGVTAGVAAPAYAGIAVTHRDLASAVAFVTGHEDPSKEESALDWDALARVPRHARALHGREEPAADRRTADRGGAPADEPAAVVERGTLPGQRDVSAPLPASPPRVEDAGLRAPAITVIGPAAAAARHPGVDRGAPAARQGGGGHPRAGAGERLGGAAGGAGGRGRRDPVDSNRAALDRPAPRSAPSRSCASPAPTAWACSSTPSRATRARSPA